MTLRDLLNLVKNFFERFRKKPPLTYSYKRKARVIYEFPEKSESTVHVRGQTQEVTIDSEIELNEEEIARRVKIRTRETSVLQGDRVCDVEIIQDGKFTRHLVV